MGKRTTIGLILLIICGTLIGNYNNKQIVTCTSTSPADYKVHSEGIYLNNSWTKDLHIDNNSPHYADLNGDGYYDIVFSIGFELYCLNGKDGSQLWKAAESSSYITFSSPCVVDIDNDSRLEVIVLGNEMSGSDTIYCYDHEGNDEWTRRLPVYYGNYPFHSSTPCVGDINFDGALEIIIGTRYGLICYDTSDYSIKEYKIDHEVYSSPSLLNVDGDANYEIIFTCSDEYIYCLDDDFSLRWKTAMIGSPISAGSSPVVYDINSDGKHEIFVGTGDRFCSYAPNGTLLWSYNCPDEFNGFEGTPAIANIDSCGPVEILIHSNYDTLYCFSEAGQLNWTYVGVGSHMTSSTPILANIDGNDWLEVIIIGDELACISKNGFEIFIEDIEHWSFANPLVGDFDADGINEIFYSEYLDTIYCQKVLDSNFNSSQESGICAWPCYKGSNYHTGNGDYDGDMLDELTEAFYNTNKSIADTDSDQFDDGWEIMVGLNPLVDDAFDDLDNDNLTNYIEAKIYHTSVFNPDTDGDGMNDGDEIAIGRDPLVIENETSLPTDFTFIFPVENIYAILFASIALIVIIKRKRNK